MIFAFFYIMNGSFSFILNPLTYIMWDAFFFDIDTIYDLNITYYTLFSCFLSLIELSFGLTLPVYFIYIDNILYILYIIFYYNFNVSWCIWN